MQLPPSFQKNKNWRIVNRRKWRKQKKNTFEVNRTNKTSKSEWFLKRINSALKTFEEEKEALNLFNTFWQGGSKWPAQRSCDKEFFNTFWMRERSLHPGVAITISNLLFQQFLGAEPWGLLAFLLFFIFLSS